MGAGEAARLLLAGIHHQGWIVLGLLDDDPAKRGARIGGVAGARHAGRRDAAGRARRRHARHHRDARRHARRSARRAIDLAAATGLPVLTVPSASELHDGSARIERVRDIEPEDLLGREPVRARRGRHRRAAVAARRCWSPAPAASIGCELCRQVARYGPARLVLYELSEFALYTIEQELGERFPRLPLVRLIGDVKDLEHLRAHVRARGGRRSSSMPRRSSTCR